MNKDNLKHTRYTHTEILNKTTYLAYNDLTFKEISLKDNTAMAANPGLYHIHLTGSLILSVLHIYWEPYT